MEKVKQKREDLEKHLQDHIRFLQNSAQSYDEGFEGEAKRMAVSIRVLFHHTNSSKSLVRQLNSELDYLDSSSKYDPENLAGFHGLACIYASSVGAKYVPRIETGIEEGEWISFSEWWNNPIIVDSKKNSFSRKELILALANKDGGAHVDPELDQAYVELSRNNTFGWLFLKGTIKSPFQAVEYASIRQICYEVLESIENSLPEYF